jgi:hypothetical protein
VVPETLVEKRMDNLTDEQLQNALKRLEPGMCKYLWLQRQLLLCDVSTSDEFQRRFSGFYRVRRNSHWKLEYFKLLEFSKLNGIDFPSALREINCRCGGLEASFASKLVATLDLSKPVIDKFVLRYFGMQLPRSSDAARYSSLDDGQRPN